jgi:dTDP-4-dehydrorhamnose 3,5-epimerase
VEVVMMELPEVVENKVYADKRGTFAPLSLATYNKKWLQSNISTNPQRLTLRGLHFQQDPFAQAKLVKVIEGEIWDFVVDIRKRSEHYLELYMYNLKPGDELYVPRGFAHGFITTINNTIVQYLVDNYYSPDHEGIIPWTMLPHLQQKLLILDSTITMENIIIHDKDLKIKNFSFDD